jgi:DNA-directed RNA polymerase subunit RPC12/RpoP
MTKPFKYYNAKCASCGDVREEMIRVGAVIFCPYCYDEIFISDDPVKEERETYLKFLRKIEVQP